MKKTLSLLVFSFYFLAAHAVWLRNVPITEVQPNGDTIHFFATGDECYHRYHDAAGYTLLMDARGYWVYAQPTQGGSIEPSQHIYPVANPASLGLQPGLTISREEWNDLKAAWEIPAELLPQPAKTSGRNHGDYCNLVIFIRFADDSAYSRSFSSIDRMFTDSSTYTSNSLYTYFRRASYDKIFMRTYYAPAPNGNTILSYQAPHPRNYYKPYSESNPEGYHSNQRSDREFDLIQGAIDYVNQYAPVPSNVVLDCNGDGLIDNVNFIVKGTYTGWSDLLWPHKWNLYGRECYINGKRVSTFNLQLEGSGAEYFGTSTFCHEMFHSLGAPDLYRYNSSSTIAPVGSWDLMASNSRPPQHMSAYMKYKYGNWLDEIPTITEPGTYTLQPLADTTCVHCCYKIPSIDTNVFFVLEFRNTDYPFEGQLPGKGLVIFRIDKRFGGNASYNDVDVFDEVWVMRPGSNSHLEDGQLARAAFSDEAHRTEFSSTSDPYPHLADGTRDMHFSVTNIRILNGELSFYYSNRAVPAGLVSRRITTASATVAWAGGSPAYRIRYRRADSDDAYSYALSTATHFTIWGLQPNVMYEWSVRSLYGDNGNYTDSSNYSASAIFHTERCNNPVSDTLGRSTSLERTGVPFRSNEKYNYTQIILTQDEIGQGRHISSINLHYAYANALTKTNCTIYMAHTTANEFSTSVEYIPASDLSMVYTGDLTFNKGWNTILLDSSFLYDGERNLVIAIDDNSGTPSRVGDKFYCKETTSRKSSVVYSGDEDHNPGPEQDSIEGVRYYHSYRPNIALTGCPLQSGSQHYACIFAEDEGMGYTDGEGLYDHGTRIFVQAYPVRNNIFKQWHDGVTTNPRLLTIVSDTLLIAIFANPAGIDTPQDAGAGYTILSQGTTATVVCSPEYPVRVFDLLGRTLLSSPAGHSGRVTFHAPAAGIYLVQVATSKPGKIYLSR